MTPYERGFIDGLTAYAIMRDGVYYIGNERTLKSCIEKVRDTWNYQEPEKTCAHIWQCSTTFDGNMAIGTSQAECSLCGIKGSSL